MKKVLILVSTIFLLACSSPSEGETSPTETNTYSEETNTEYTLIRDNLYTDKEGTLYLRSREQEHFETGKWVDVWIKTVYCDTCWTPTEHGWTDITELKDFVNVNTFHLDTTDRQQGGDFYEDKYYRYFHKWMADGGTIAVMGK